MLISIDTIAEFIYRGSSYQASYRLGWVSAIFGKGFLDWLRKDALYTLAGVWFV